MPNGSVPDEMNSDYVGWVSYAYDYCPLRKTTLLIVVQMEEGVSWNPQLSSLNVGRWQRAPNKEEG
jgi:hypothetical protein